MKNGCRDDGAIMECSPLELSLLTYYYPTKLGIYLSGTTGRTTRYHTVYFKLLKSTLKVQMSTGSKLEMDG